jgi:hypothetical protein
MTVPYNCSVAASGPLKMAWVGVGKENVKMEVTAGSGKKMQHKWE